MSLLTSSTLLTAACSPSTLFDGIAISSANRRFVSNSPPISAPDSVLSKAIAMPSNSVEGLQAAVKRVEEVSKDMGMRINVTKTEVQYLGKGKKECHIQIDG